MSGFVDTLKQLGPSRLAIMGGILVGMLLFFVFVSLRVATPEMKLLYGDLASVDSGAIAAKLEEAGIPYAVSPDGTRISASAEDIGRARLLLAEAGLPNGGSLGYKIFDQQSGFGTTNFVQNINQVRALEGELVRTISSLESVRSARVHLVLPQRELFSREPRPSSASVYLGIRPGAHLEQQTIYAIQSLVASAVPDLKATNVTIIDSNGTLLAKGGGETEAGMMSAKAEEMRRNYESRLTEKIEDQVSRVVGFGSVRAIVTAEMNFDRISTNEEVFDPEGQVVRSTQSNSENSLERTPLSEEVGVQNNLPGVGGNLLADNQPSTESTATGEVTNFEISKTLRNTVREVGEVQKLSISVLIDGRYTTAENGDKIYEERSPEELQKIEDLVRSATGFNTERGDILTVRNMRFAEIDVGDGGLDESLLFGFEKSDLISMAEILLISIMIILVVLLVLQPMVSRLLSTEGGDMPQDIEADLLAMRPMNPALAAPVGGGEDYIPPEPSEEESLINIQGVEGKVKSSSIKKVEEIVENYPSETVSVIRSWMTQES
ncbi:MAG: flagellar M-ring protein FliF [Alphaproteobacteria bacterium]|nr:flagellar M-ring protein FliF [Alphaproteobacteria bacterium]